MQPPSCSGSRTAIIVCVRLRWHATFDRAVEAEMPFAVPTLWPPPAAVAAGLRLERCSRLLHHDQVRA